MSAVTKANIKKLLDLTGVTHEQLGRIAGVQRSAVSHWVSGKSEPRMGALQRIADYYGITTANLADPGGMQHIYRGADGKLHEDKEARIRDLKEMVASVDQESSSSEVFYIYQSARLAGKRESVLNRDEKELVDMFRALNDNGKQMALATLAAYVKSGNFS